MPVKLNGNWIETLKTYSCAFKYGRSVAMPGRTLTAFQQQESPSFHATLPYTPALSRQRRKFAKAKKLLSIKLGLLIYLSQSFLFVYLEPLHQNHKIAKKI
jgi:hypothetical protein